MIKIIEKGTRVITICENCGCKFSYEDEDIETENLHRKYIFCPQCKAQIYIGAYAK